MPIHIRSPWAGNKNITSDNIQIQIYKAQVERFCCSSVISNYYCDHSVSQCSYRLSYAVFLLFFFLLLTRTSKQGRREKKRKVTRTSTLTFRCSNARVYCPYTTCALGTFPFFKQQPGESALDIVGRYGELISNFH